MEQDIQRILKGIEAIYKQLKDIDAKLDRQTTVVVPMESSKPRGKFSMNAITDKQLRFLTQLLENKPQEIKQDILVKFNVDQLNQLTSKDASDLISKYKESNKKEFHGASFR